MDMLQLIKTRATTRKYTRKKVPRQTVKKIIEAGIWGPAIHHFQPWKFIVVSNKPLMQKIAVMVEKKLKKFKIPAFVAYPTNATLRNATLFICAYNTKSFSKTMSRYNRTISRNFELAEISAIAACIQNMILTIEDLKLGSCWLDMPLFCRKEINKLLNQKGDLVALLAVGYPNARGVRSNRIKTSEAVSYVD